MMRFVRTVVITAVILVLPYYYLGNILVTTAQDVTGQHGLAYYQAYHYGLGTIVGFLAFLVMRYVWRRGRVDMVAQKRLRKMHAAVEKLTTSLGYSVSYLQDEEEKDNTELANAAQKIVLELRTFIDNREYAKALAYLPNVDGVAVRWDGPCSCGDFNVLESSSNLRRLLQDLIADEAKSEAEKSGVKTRLSAPQSAATAEAIQTH